MLEALQERFWIVFGLLTRWQSYVDTEKLELNYTYRRSLDKTNMTEFDVRLTDSEVDLIRAAARRFAKLVKGAEGPT